MTNQLTQLRRAEAQSQQPQPWEAIGLHASIQFSLFVTRPEQFIFEPVFKSRFVRNLSDALLCRQQSQPDNFQLQRPGDRIEAASPVSVNLTR